MPFVQDNSSHDLAIQHWKTYLDGFKPCHFPALCEGMPNIRDDFQETTIKLDMENRVLLDACSRFKLTPYSIFQTAWAIVIGCYAGVEDVCFVHSTNNVCPSELKIENSFICRTQITAKTPLLETMVNMKKDFNKASTHRRWSTAEIRDLLGLKGQTLFNSGLQIERSSVIELGQETQEAEMVECDILARILIEDGVSLAVSVRTRTSKFSAAQTADVTHTLGKTLSEIVSAHRRCMIGDLDIFSQHDYEKVMSWNESILMSVDNCFHQCFEEVVRTAPDAPAICSWDGNLTYGELDILSTRLGNNLAHLGVVPESFVLICFNKVSMAYVSMLSILKAGGAFVAIDPLYPASRIQAIIAATNASIVVVEPAHCHLFENIMERVVAIDYKSADELPHMPSVRQPQPSPSNTAYAVFTSGSTGTPKGILVEHRNLCTAALGLALPMRINSSSRVLQFAAYTFDLSYGDIFVTLSQGGCICVPSEHERMNDLVGAIVRMNVNTACLIPSVARMIQPEDVPGLETLLLGGEALIREDLERWTTKVALATLYGPSECTIWCTAQPALRLDSPANIIGRGVGALLWVTSTTNHDRLCPVGCIGELLIEGPVVARGYFDFEQTDQSFIENPSWAKTELGKRRRFYKSGDLVRLKSNGDVLFIGRKDTQIKLHGRRIEMGEIEYHLSSHDLLRQSMVMLPATGVYHGKLVAIVVFKTSKAPCPRTDEVKVAAGVTKQVLAAEMARFKDFLSTRLPLYMLPQHWIIIEDIPLMASGKMNRRLVKDLVEGLALESHDKYFEQQPTHKNLDKHIETHLRNIWSSVLQRDVADIGVEQHFISLGGDSFTAMELVARCRTEGHTLTVGDIFGCRTIRKIASILKTPSSGVAAIEEQPRASRRVGVHSLRTSPLKYQPVWWNAEAASANYISGDNDTIFEKS